MKKISTLVLSVFFACLFFSESVQAKLPKLVITADTLMYDSVPTGENAFDTVIVQNGAALWLTHADSADAFKGGYNLQAHKWFEVMPGSSAKGVPGMEGYLAVNKGVIINSSGRDSIYNININLYGSDTIRGYPSTINKVIAGDWKRHLFVDTTTTLIGAIYMRDQRECSVFYGSDTLILGDTCTFPLKKKRAYFIPGDGGVLLRKVSIDDLNVSDTIPIGFTTDDNVANWVVFKLNNGISLGLDAHVSIELMPQSHPAKGMPADYLGFYVKVSGYNITSLDYDLSFRYTTTDVSGDTSSLRGAMYNAGWLPGNKVNNVDMESGWVSFTGLTSWGEFTAFSAPYVTNVLPADASTDVAVDSLIRIIFSEDVDSVDFSGIELIDNMASVNVPVTLVWDDLNNTIFIDHDSLEVNKTYTIVIPDSVVKNLNDLYNPYFEASFSSVLVGINTTTKEKDVRVYPVPSLDGQITIEGKDLRMVKVYNLIGNLVYQGEKDINTLNLSFLPEGIYILNIYQNNLVITKRIKL